MKLRTLFFIGLSVTIVSFSSCKKRKLNRSTTTSQDNAIAEMAFNDVLKVTEDAMKEEGLEKSSSGLPACANVSISPALPDTTFPKTITIDFGTQNCEDAYKVNRRGKIIINTTGRYRTEGTVITITTQDYYVNDYKVEGTKIVTNLGPNSAGNTEFSIDINNALITFPNGEDQVSYESDRIREWVIGENTQGLGGFLDDEYDITGTASGVNREGRSYTMTITSALRVAVICHWVKQGVIEIQPEDLYKRTVDFGNGDCDANATVEVNGHVYNFIMR